MTTITHKPWHPFIFGIFYVLSIYQTNAEHHPISVVPIPLLGTGLVVLIIFGMIAALTKNLRSGALYSSLLILVLLVFPFLQENIFNATGWDPSIWLFLIIITGVILVLRKTGREKHQSPKLAYVLNVVALCCLLPPLFLTMGTRAGVADGQQVDNGLPSMESWAISADPVDADITDAPDIIHIVLDGYARNDVLKRIYSYDNAPFLEALEELGFYVADQAAANYCQTGLSMSSALNVHYLNFPPKFNEANDRKILKALFQQSSVPVFLKNLGYSLRLYDSGYFLTDTMVGAELIETAGSVWNEFSYEVVRKSILWLPGNIRRALMVQLGDRTLYRQHRERVLNALSLLSDEPVAAAAPTYTLVHMLTPHPPFIFSEDEEAARRASQMPYSLSDGSHRLKELPGGQKEYQEQYVGQLKAVNKMLLPTITSMFTNAKRPVVIVVQSDHGPGSSLDWNNIMESDGQERLGILAAIYFSDRQYESLYEDITPINLWRVILNKYFLTEKLPLLEDKSYLSSWPRPYLFHEYAAPDLP